MANSPFRDYVDRKTKERSSKKPGGNWIAGAIKHPGAFTAKAKAAGEGVQEYASHVLAPGSEATTKTKRQAALARTLARMH